MKNYFEFNEQIKNNQIPPIMLLYGTESYFIQKIKEQLQTIVLNKEMENLSVYDLEETPIEQVITDAETYPFFGEQKLIFASNPLFLLARPPKISFEHQIARLEAYIKAPGEYTVLVLIAPYEKIDQRKRITRLLKKSATIVHCPEIKDYEIINWIKQLATDFKITIKNEALDLMQTKLTTDLQLIETELEKLALYVGENGIITKDIAEDLLASTVDSSALELVDAVMERNYEKAFLIYRDLALMNEEPIGMLALLAYQFRMILQVKLLRNKGYNQNQIHRQIGGHPYVIKIALQRERRFTKERLTEILNKLTKADAQIKFGHTEKDLAFELLLYNLITI